MRVQPRHWLASSAPRANFSIDRSATPATTTIVAAAATRVLVVAVARTSVRFTPPLFPAPLRCAVLAAIRKLRSRVHTVRTYNPALRLSHARKRTRVLMPLSFRNQFSFSLALCAIYASGRGKSTKVQMLPSFM